MLPSRTEVSKLFFVKGHNIFQSLNILGFEGHTIYVRTIHLCWSMKAAIDSRQTDECGCSNKALFINEAVG